MVIWTIPSMLRGVLWRVWRGILLGIHGMFGVIGGGLMLSFLLYLFVLNLFTGGSYLILVSGSSIGTNESVA